VPRIGQLPLAKLNREHIEGLYADLRTSGGRDRKPLAPKTVWNIHLTLSSALKEARDRGVISADIISGACTMPRSSSEQKTWNEIEMEVFLDRARHDRLAAGWFLAVLGGLRRGEILGLRWGDVDLDASTVTITRSLSRNSKGLTIEEPKTRRSRRTIEISPRLVAVLLRTQEQQQLDKLAARTAYDSGDLVVATALGRPVDPDNFSARFRGSILTLRRCCVLELR
jgi:integrase